MVVEMLNCKDKDLIVVDALKLKMTKDIVIAMAQHTGPVNGKAMNLQPLGFSKAQQWLKQQALDIVDGDGSCKELQVGFDVLSFDKAFIVITQKKEMAIVDDDGLKELEKQCKVERNMYACVTLEQLLDFVQFGFIDADVPEVIARRDSLERFIDFAVEKTGKDTDNLPVAKLYQSFVSEYGSLEKIDFYNDLLSVVGKNDIVTIDNTKCLRGSRWRDDGDAQKE